MKSSVSLILLLLLGVTAFAQNAQREAPVLQRPADIQDAGINEYVGEVFSLYAVVRQFQFDLGIMGDEIAAMEANASVSGTPRKTDIRQKLAAYGESWIQVNNYLDVVTKKMPVVEKAAAKLHPETEVTQANANLATCKEAIEQINNLIRTQMKKTDDLVAKLKTI